MPSQVQGSAASAAGIPPSPLPKALPPAWMGSAPSLPDPALLQALCWWGCAAARSSRDLTVQATSCNPQHKPTTACSNGTWIQPCSSHSALAIIWGLRPHHNPEVTLEQGVPVRSRQSAAGCSTESPVHPISPLCWCCAGHTRTPMHAITNGRNTRLTCIIHLRPKAARLALKSQASSTHCCSQCRPGCLCA